jgi:hypothetical protein
MAETRTMAGVHAGKARVRAEPFDAVDLALGPVWGEVEAPPREG